MKEIIRKVLVGAVIVGLTFIGFKFIMGFKKEPKINELIESIKLVDVRTVRLDTIELTIPVYGNLRSLNEIELFPEIGGILKSGDFREGKQYQKGDVIAFIDNRELLSTIKSQKSNLLNLVAKLISDLKFDFPNQVADWERFLGEIKFDQPLPDLPNVADLKLKNYLAGKNLYNTYYAIQSQEERLQKYTIVAPFDGILTEAMIKPGTAVRVGQKIGKFINPSEFELKVNVTLVDGSKIAIGDNVRLRSNDMAGEWDGRVERINKTLSEDSQNMNVFVRVNSDQLYNGMYLLGEIQLEEKPNTIEIDRSLLVDANSIFKVMDNKLVQHPINILQMKEESVVISGVKNNDVILNQSVKGAYHNMKVRFN